MISLEQIRQLDIRVKRAVGAIRKLTTVNESLTSELTGAHQRIAELEGELGSLRQRTSDLENGEQKIEVGLQGVLDVLDEIDDSTADVYPDDNLTDNTSSGISGDDAREADADSVGTDKHTDTILSETAIEDSVAMDEALPGNSVEPEPENEQPGNSVDQEQSGHPEQTEKSKQSKRSEKSGTGELQEAGNNDVDEVNLDDNSGDVPEGESEFQSEFDIF